MATMIFDHDGYKAFSVRGGGLVLRAPTGREVFVQPGDDTEMVRGELDALEEDGLDVPGLVATCLGEYFAN